jgi:hypothetical protein
LKKLKKFLILLLLSISALAQSTQPVPVVGNINAINGVPAGTNNYIEFALVNCGSTQPTVNGVAVMLNAPVDFYPGPNGTLVASDGVTPAALYGNDIIQCGNIGNTSRYSMTQFVNGQPAGPTKYYFVQSGSGLSFNINTAIPIYVLPPLKYPNPTQCPSGQMIAGLNNDLSPICVNLPTSADNAVVLNPSGNQIVSQPSGTWLSVNNFALKLPRVDVRHPDFALGADPTGIRDSTAAIQAALNFALNQPIVAGSTPVLYLSAGKYKVSGELRVTKPMRIMGDGIDQTVLMTTSPTENLITVAPASGLTNNGCTQPYCGVQIDDLTLMGNGPSSTGDLLELENGYLYKVWNVRMADHGGRGLQVNNTERGEFDNLSIYGVRLPIVLSKNTNETYFHNITVLGGQTLTGNYSYDVNAVNGVYPAPNAGVCANYPAWQAGTAYPVGSIICDSNFNLERAIASGTPSYSGNNLVWTPGTSGSSTPTWPAGDLATTVDSGVTWRNESHRTVLKPNYHAAIYVNGANLKFDGGSIKTTQSSAGIAVFAGEAVELTHLYVECFVGHCTNPGVEVNPIDYFPLLNGLPSGALSAAVSNSAWAQEYYNSPSDLSTFTNSGNVVGYAIIPPDYNAMSSAVSSCGNGLLQNQYEIVWLSGFSGDGNVYLWQRQATVNGISSTSPANYSWCAGSKLVKLLSSTHGAINLRQDHIESSVVTESTGYTSTCGDQNTGNGCADVLIGPQPDNASVPTPSTGTGFVSSPSYASVELSLDDTSLYRSTTDSWTGHGYIKCFFHCHINAKGTTILQAQLTQSNAQLQGFVVGEYVFTDVLYPAKAASLDLMVNDRAWINGQTGTMESRGLQYNGGNPYGVFHQFTDEYCDIDVQSSAQSWIRNCIYGGPRGSNGYKRELDVWNGTNWVNAFSVTLSNAGASNASAALGGIAASGIPNAGGSQTVTGAWTFNNASTLFQNGSGQSLLSFYADGVKAYDNLQCQPVNNATSSNTFYGCHAYKNFNWYNGTSNQAGQMYTAQVPDSTTSTPTKVTFQDRFANNSGLNMIRDFSSWNEVDLPNNSKMSGNPVMGALSATPSGTCTANGYITAYVNGVSVHIATCQ